MYVSGFVVLQLPLSLILGTDVSRWAYTVDYSFKNSTFFKQQNYYVVQQLLLKQFH